MINIDNISFSYLEKTVIKDFSLKIKKGEHICLYGESGCGKTTLLKLIMGLIKPQKGIISLPENLKFSTVFQENRLFPFYNVLKNIEIIGAEKETALNNLKALGLEGTENLILSKLSGGMERRVSIARALSVDFDVLILDEPFTGLDNENIKKSANHILKTVGDKTLILVSHSIFEAELLNAKKVTV